MLPMIKIKKTNQLEITCFNLAHGFYQGNEATKLYQLPTQLQ